MRLHFDERRAAYCDLFPEAGLPGDLNVFDIEPNQCTAWHRHEKQTDRFWCANGSITIRWWQGSVYHQETLWGGDEKIVTIPPGYWHGYRAGPEGAVVVMYLDRHFDPLDEFRGTPEELGVPFP